MRVIAASQYVSEVQMAALPSPFIAMAYGARCVTKKLDHAAPHGPIHWETYQGDQSYGGGSIVLTGRAEAFHACECPR